MADTEKQKRYSGLKPFKPGQSGNPKGRPKKDVSLTSLLKKYLDEVPSVKIGDKVNTELTWRQLIVQAWLVGAYRGNATLFKELIERLEGKVAQPITGGEGEPLLQPIIYLHMPDGTVVKSPRNGHKEVAELETTTIGHSDNGT